LLAGFAAAQWFLWWTWFAQELSPLEGIRVSNAPVISVGLVVHLSNERRKSGTAAAQPVGGRGAGCGV
jgi:hypothetical protein